VQRAAEAIFSNTTRAACNEAFAHEAPSDDAQASSLSRVPFTKARRSTEDALFIRDTARRVPATGGAFPVHRVSLRRYERRRLFFVHSAYFVMAEQP